LEQEETMRKKLIPMFAGLALLTGSAALHAQDVYKDKEKAKVEKNGDVKVKEKTTDETGKHKTKTKVKHHGDEVKVKEKTP
jgi:hypothetical protein